VKKEDDEEELELFMFCSVQMERAGWTHLLQSLQQNKHSRPSRHVRALHPLSLQTTVARVMGMKPPFHPRKAWIWFQV
jgi:hypothetical protein